MQRRSRLLIIPVIMAAFLLGLLAPTVVAPPEAVAAPAQDRPAPTTGRASSPTTKTMTLLVIRAYFDRNTDSAASVDSIFSRANGWFAAVSGHRQRFAPTVTPAYRVAQPCHGIDRRAAAAAAQHGYHLDRYQLIVVLAPTCHAQSGAEHAQLDTMVPRHLTLWGSAGRSQAVVVHQLGHALGLDDSLLLGCWVGSRAVTVGTAKQCTAMYSDEDVDVMGGGEVVGSFSAPDLAALHWFGAGQATSRSSGTSTFTLHPLLGSGLRTVRVQASSDVAYWLEYRTRTGVDAGMHSSTIGVVIRRVSARETNADSHMPRPVLIDMDPAGWLDALRPGSSWTAPEGVSIAVSSEDSAGAHLTVRFKAPRPSVPAAPRVTVANGDDQVRVSWTRPVDHGRPVTRFDVGIVDAKGREVVSAIKASRDAPSVVLPVANGVYTARVRAVNDLGSSAWGTAKAAPAPAVPSISILSPATGEVVDGRYLRVRLAAAPNPISRSPIAVTVRTLSGPGIAALRERNGQWTGMVDLEPDSDGRITVEASARAADNRMATTTVDVEVPTRLSAPSITSPASGTIWTSGPLAVSVIPGVDRLTGERVPSVAISIGATYRYANAANDWTVSFEHDEIDDSTFSANMIVAKSQGHGILVSPATLLPISYR